MNAFSAALAAKARKVISRSPTRPVDSVPRLVGADGLLERLDFDRLGGREQERGISDPE